MRLHMSRISSPPNLRASVSPLTPHLTGPSLAPEHTSVSVRATDSRGYLQVLPGQSWCAQSKQASWQKG